MEIRTINARDLMTRRGFLFLNPDETERDEGTTNIDLNKVNAQNLSRYCTKLYYDEGTRINYRNQIKTIVEDYLNEILTDKDLKAIEKMKEEERKAIEKAKEKGKPKFPWDLSNKNKKEKNQ